jgi:flagellar hook-associated protein 3 FlgL
MRITDNMQLTSVLLDESRASQQVYQLSQESASGNLINAPSDDPTGFGTLVTIDSQLSVMQGRSSAVSAAASNLDAASGALSSASNLLDQAKQLAIEGANGTEDPSSRANTATQVQGLVQQMIELGNTQGTAGYLFGGTNTGTPPFDAAGNFTGNNGVTQVAVSDTVLANSNVSGADAFTSAGGGSNVIADLQSLATALSTNNTAAISASITQMSTDQQQVIAVMVQAGSASSSLTASGQMITNTITATQVNRSTLDNAGTASVYSELEAAQNSYQAAVNVTQQILSLSSFTTSTT